MADSLKKQVLTFIGKYHGQHGKVPSIKTVKSQFKISNARFYQIFPGLAEACQQAGCPIPKGRIKQTLNAKRKVKVLVKVKEATAQKGNRFILTENQTARLQGISHLEGGKDPALIVDELLDLDRKLRRDHGLTLEDIQIVPNFLKDMVERGWKLKQIQSYLTDLWNSGYSTLGFPEGCEVLGLFKKLKELGWPLIEFVDYAREYYDEIKLLKGYNNGELSFEEFNERMVNIIEG